MSEDQARVLIAALTKEEKILLNELLKSLEQQRAYFQAQID